MAERLGPRAEGGELLETLVHAVIPACAFEYLSPKSRAEKSFGFEPPVQTVPCCVLVSEVDHRDSEIR
ncbi:hypothetical protein [Curtobacterium luteum]|uniref:hypothetical protein n=1 Tax=Curtobacterium luteum TaxID=33881 RepID=UPI00382ACFE8